MINILGLFIISLCSSAAISMDECTPLVNPEPSAPQPTPDQESLIEAVNNVIKSSGALRNAYLEEVARILARVDANVQCENGLTLLYIASYYGDLPLVKLLFDKGALVNQWSQIAYMNSTGTIEEKWWSPLGTAAFRGHTEVVEFLFNAGAKPSIGDCNEALEIYNELKYPSPPNEHDKKCFIM